MTLGLSFVRGMDKILFGKGEILTNTKLQNGGGDGMGLCCVFIEFLPRRCRQHSTHHIFLPFFSLRFFFLTL